jgi:hypothetical protein
MAIIKDQPGSRHSPRGMTLQIPGYPLRDRFSFAVQKLCLGIRGLIPKFFQLNQ